MFLLAEMKDVIQIMPYNFGHDFKSSLEFGLNKKFANKVVHNVGLCIVLFDITHIGDSYILPGNGASHTPVTFRFIVFRPFIDEVLVAKVKSCTREGVQVSLGFFDDIFIPYEYLQQKSKFVDAEQLWVWQYETEEGSHDLYMDINEEIRIRVIDEEFLDLTPEGPAPPTIEGETKSLETKKLPYTITASISESGLGLLSWWT
ncbi:DNA-directed RNA polymerase III subunit RPC8 isoform X1 [Hydra vulgaris]|uniref:DNA-directed RNA polymerase III subunit RPC8 isoform X2 n=1 Tax=Hydra vulgaris TaxID=6087 RepID=A0ABM4CBR0_HYDVU